MKPGPVIAAGLAAGLGWFAFSSVRGAVAGCGVHGARAPADVVAAVLDAWAARGYPRREASRAVDLESGWRARAVSCNPTTGHPIAGGLLQQIGSSLRSVGYMQGPARFAALEARDQLPYVLAFVASLPRWVVPGDARLALYRPAFVGAPDASIVDVVGSSAWVLNPSLRDGKSGPITAASVRRTVL